MKSSRSANLKAKGFERKQPRKSQPILLRLYDMKQISDAELFAGLSYERDCGISGLEKYSTIVFDQVGVDASGFNPANDNLNPTELQMIARSRLHRMNKMLGPLTSSCFYNVLGKGWTMKDWAHHVSSGQVAGLMRRINEHQAMGIFLAGLSFLAPMMKK